MLCKSLKVPRIRQKLINHIKTLSPLFKLQKWEKIKNLVLMVKINPATILKCHHLSGQKKVNTI